MVTKSITLFYKVTPEGVEHPPKSALDRQQEWLRTIQKTMAKKDKPILIKTVCTIHNPEIENMVKFFNGAVVDYFTIQSKDLLSGDIPPLMRKMAREELLDSALGYELKMLTKSARRRKSTANFTNVQQWNDLLKRLEETEFEPNGYFFPDSKEFWELQAKHGYDEAKEISIQQLRHRMQKLSTPSD